MDQSKTFSISSGIKWGILSLQILLFGVSVIAPIHLGTEHLNTTGIISISFDWMAMVILTIIFRNCCNGRALANTKAFMWLIVTLYLCVFFEVGIWVFDRLADCRIPNYICNIGANCTILACAYLYFLFIRKSKGIDVAIFPRLGAVLRIAMTVGIIAEILNIFAGYFYEIDKAGVYIRSPYGSYLGFVPFLVILAGSVLFILRQKLNWHIKLMYMSYCIVPFICGLWYTFTGYPPTFFAASAISILLINGDIYVVQSKESEFFELKTAKVEAEYALTRNELMLSQIKPHFLYNSLGSIEVLCRLDPEKAEQAIHHFTQYLRSNMDAINSNDTIPFSRELEHIHNYVWLEQMRFADDLAYKEEIETLDFRVPQLSIQPLVENAIKHGMMGNADGVLHVVLKVTENEDEYIIKVCDDGCGFDPTQLPEDGKSHLGLHNAAYSLQLRLNGAMAIDSQIGIGTTITIRIPKAEGGRNA